MTTEQIRMAQRLVGKMPRDEIAKACGVSVSSLKRAFRGVRICYFNKYVANPNLVEAVCRYYEKHGKNKTQERFPNVKVRSVVERYKNFNPRTIRWTDEQIIEAARMAGIISKKAQAEYFNRPNAHLGSITSLWMKRFGRGGGSVNGLAWYVARQFVRPSCPRVQTAVWAMRQTHKNTFQSRTVALWVDVATHIKAAAPEWFRSTAVALARYQRWLWKTERVHASVLKMIKEREVINVSIKRSGY
jgi:AcrR family transcriptional regulator